MHLIAIGRLRQGPELELFERYNTRLRSKLTVTELPEERGAPAVVKRKESAALLAALPRDAFAVAMDLGGAVIGSESLGERLNQWTMLGRPICFLIGGAEGLDQAVIARADYVLSFGKLTWPHFLVRPMLAEQLYRAQAINSGHPYHRDGRPAS